MYNSRINRAEHSFCRNSQILTFKKRIWNIITYILKLSKASMYSRKALLWYILHIGNLSSTSGTFLKNVKIDFIIFCCSESSDKFRFKHPSLVSRETLATAGILYIFLFYYFILILDIYYGFIPTYILTPIYWFLP